MIAATLPTVRMPLMTPALRTLVWMLMCDDDRLTITSIGDGVHAPGSAHYRGEAIDVRSHDLGTLELKRARQARLQASLGAAFTVQLEPYDVPGSRAAEHLHLQLNAGQEGEDRWIGANSSPTSRP